ncbi:hypothetical protein G2W53_038203 [Senna tora]|uniref:Uncharacterized protein n=1 Tax=Senna tora TaxID=362788 RepID=A0A834SRG1_9FABA|nr:hypothetical protein G2W53_038203 [Senna tora]
MRKGVYIDVVQEVRIEETVPSNQEIVLQQNELGAQEYSMLVLAQEPCYCPHAMKGKFTQGYSGFHCHIYIISIPKLCNQRTKNKLIQNGFRGWCRRLKGCSSEISIGFCNSRNLHDCHKGIKLQFILLSFNNFSQTNTTYLDLSLDLRTLVFLFLPVMMPTSATSIRIPRKRRLTMRRQVQNQRMDTSTTRLKHRVTENPILDTKFATGILTLSGASRRTCTIIGIPRHSTMNLTTLPCGQLIGAFGSFPELTHVDDGGEGPDPSENWVVASDWREGEIGTVGIEGAEKPPHVADRRFKKVGDLAEIGGGGDGENLAEDTTVFPALADEG